MRLATAACISVVVSASACSSRAPGKGPRPGRGPSAPDAAAAAPARAFRITAATDLIPGAGATGALGDFRLENGLVAVVISDAARAYGFSESGGNLVDVAPRGGRDVFSQLFLYLDDTFPRQARNHTVLVSEAGGEVAAITVDGEDSKNPALAIRTEFRLARGDDTLVVRTTVENRGESAVTGYEIGDVIAWGQAEHFAPGHGFSFRGRLELPWIAGVGDAMSLGYAGSSGSFGGPHGSAWSDTILTAADLAPGEKTSVERFVVVRPEADAQVVSARLLARRGEATQTLHGVVIEVPGGAAVAGALVTAQDDHGRPLVVARTGAGGRFTITVPTGKAPLLVAAGPGRRAAAPPTPATAAGETTLLVTQPSTLVFEIDEVFADGRRAPSPGRLTLRGVGATPDPILGPRYRAAGAGNVVASGDGRGAVAMAAGRYRVVVSRGPEFDLVDREIELVAGQTTTLTAALHRVVDTTGWVSADFHQHALPSPDSSVSIADRLIANVAEGVEVAVATDHNQITDYAEVLADLDLAAPLATIVGLEATTERIGHFQAYPLVRREGASRGGAPLVDGETPTVIFARLRALAPDLVIQVNHPRALSSGYFTLGGFPAPDEHFDALEVLNGKRIADFEPVLADWFALLGRGVIVTATGGSDSHYVVGQEVGYPRTFLAVGGDDPRVVTPAQVLEVIKRTRAAVVTNGPFPTLTAQGVSLVGTTVAAGRGKAVGADLVVQAAPWVAVDRIEVYKDGAKVRTIPVAPAQSPVRARERLSFDAPGAWVVVIRGDRSLDPVVPDDDGHGVTPIAVTNPVWVTW